MNFSRTTLWLCECIFPFISIVFHFNQSGLVLDSICEWRTCASYLPYLMLLYSALHTHTNVVRTAFKWQHTVPSTNRFNSKPIHAQQTRTNTHTNDEHKRYIKFYERVVFFGHSFFPFFVVSNRLHFVVC